MTGDPTKLFDRYWWVKKRHPERRGQMCAVLERMGNCNIKVLFRDGCIIIGLEGDVRLLEGNGINKWRHTMDLETVDKKRARRRGGDTPLLSTKYGG